MNSRGRVEFFYAPKGVFFFPYVERGSCNFFESLTKLYWSPTPSTSVNQSLPSHLWPYFQTLKGGVDILSCFISKYFLINVIKRLFLWKAIEFRYIKYEVEGRGYFLRGFACAKGVVIVFQVADQILTTSFSPLVKVSDGQGILGF